MTPDFPFSRDLVLIGGGHSHALVLRKWGMMALAGVRVTVINPGPTAPYSGMLPGFVAGHYTRDDLAIDLFKLARFANARLITGAVTAIDRAAKTITVPGRPPIGYDVASINIGITSGMPDLPGFAEWGIPAKPLGPFAGRWDAFRAAKDTKPIAVIGGGVAGAELALAMRYALQQAGLTQNIHLVDRSGILTGLGQSARDVMLRALSKNDISIIENAEIEQITQTGLKLADGQEIAAGFVTGAAGAKPFDWQMNIGVDCHEGYIAVSDKLQSSDPDIFAAGDCAHMTTAPRPKAGVFAVRQAPVLFDNLRAQLSGGSLRGYRPQGDYLKLISLGQKSALAEKFGRTLRGPWVWRWKDHIDRKFMHQFKDLPSMEVAAPPRTTALGLAEAMGDKPMCGGCGAKVGCGALRAALQALPATDRADVRAIAGDDAATLHMGRTRQVISTDHLRGFNLDPVIVGRVAAVHALGDIWAMGAAPQAATVQVILQRMSDEMQQRTLTEMMTAIHQVVADAGAAIVGGHSSLGSELTVGLTVTGLCDRAPITLAGAKPGDALILTKPIGSGTIMAAEMAGQARGELVQGALEQMQQGQGVASGILGRARAMTDVTGFGLAGHLAGICEASNCGAAVDLGRVPLMHGAMELGQAGIRSSLYGQNRANIPQVVAGDDALAALMFDPQTAGGLLAAVPAKEAKAIITRLQKAGYNAAAIIGQITDGPQITFS